MTPNKNIEEQWRLEKQRNKECADKMSSELEKQRQSIIEELKRFLEEIPKDAVCTIENTPNIYGEDNPSGKSWIEWFILQFEAISKIKEME